MWRWNINQFWVIIAALPLLLFHYVSWVVMSMKFGAHEAIFATHEFFFLLIFSACMLTWSSTSSFITFRWYIRLALISCYQLLGFGIILWNQTQFFDL